MKTDQTGAIRISKMKVQDMRRGAVAHLIYDKGLVAPHFHSVRCVNEIILAT